jgi:hypothetical protein
MARVPHNIRFVRSARTERILMTRMLLAAALLLSGLSAAAAQQATPEQERACKSDATRFCRKVMKDGDQAVLRCLKNVRDKLSERCRAVLEETGN